MPGVAGVGEKTASALLKKFGDIDGLLAAVDDPDSDLAPGPRRKVADARDYLAVAPEVVAVACDLDLGTPDLTLPREPRDPEMLAALAEEFNLDGPVRRLTETLAG